MTITRLLARPMLATIFVAGGVNALRNTEVHAARAKKVTDRFVPAAQQAAPKAPIPTDPATLVRINAGAQLLAAAALATGRAPRLSATVLAASLVPTTLAGHAFWDETDTGGQEAISVGTKVALKMYPEGTTAADTYYYGTASPTRITRRAQGPNSMVEVDFSFVGDGAITKGTA